MASVLLAVALLVAGVTPDTECQHVYDPVLSTIVCAP